MRRNHLLQIMTNDKRYPFFSVATVLQGISLLYGCAVRLRRWLYHRSILPSYQLPCTVVSVGNLAVGGTGKTPMVIHLAGLIRRLGYTVVIISRGYKGQAQHHGAVVSNGRRRLCGVQRSGDEPYLMASLLEGVPVVVGKDRYAAGKMAVQQFRPDVILLDDAYQHLRLRRNLNLLLIDARSPFGNTCLLPRGRLREPLSAIRDADAIVVTHADVESDFDIQEMRDKIKRRLPMFRSGHKGIIRGVVQADANVRPLDRLDVFAGDLNGRSIFAFSGLADNSGFFDTIRGWGGDLRGTLAFEDHHNYRDRDIESIAEAALESGARYLMTTDKDYVRFSRRVAFPLELVVVGVDLEFRNDDHAWRRFIEERLTPLVQRGKKP